MRTLTSLSSVVLLGLSLITAPALTVGLCGVAHAALTLPATAGAATRSGLPGFDTWEMPDGVLHLAEAAEIRDLTAKLNDYAAENGLMLHATEALTWMNEGRDDYHNRDTENGLKSQFLGAGFTYKDRGEMGGADYRFTARGSGGRAVAGLWTVHDGYLVLVWGSAGGAEKASRADLTDTPAPPTALAPSAASVKDILPLSHSDTPTGTGRKIAVPTSLVGGTWSWTTIGGVSYQSTTTGQIAEPSGMSARFTFTKDGHYTYFFYIRQRTYGLVSESTTTESGAVAFQDDGTFLLRPARGHYKGDTGSRLIDRDMTAAERAPKTFYWEWRLENGRRQLYLGPARSALSPFKRA